MNSPADAPEPNAADSQQRRTRVELTPARLALILVVLLAGVIVLSSIRGGNKATNATDEQQNEQGLNPLAKGAIDTFDRPDVDSLSTAQTGEKWTFAGGAKFGIQGGSAYLVDKPNDRRGVATVDTGSADSSVQLTMTKVAPGCGPMFRSRGEIDYWALSALPELGVWNLIRVTPQKAERVATISDQPLQDGVTIRIDTIGTQMRVYFNGNLGYEQSMPEPLTGQKAGLFCGGSTEDAKVARFDNFVASPLAVPGAGSSASDSLATASVSSVP